MSNEEHLYDRFQEALERQERGSAGADHKRQRPEKGARIS